MVALIVEKKCCKCKSMKPIAQFYIDISRGDEYSYTCRPCAKNRAKKWRDSEHGRKVKKDYAKFYSSTENGKKSVRLNDKRRKEKNPEFWFAKEKIHEAVRKGRLPRIRTLFCAHCSQPARERHHHKGYAPEHIFDTIPLCIRCHKKVHQPNGALLER